jgi:hypothetical protein
MSKKTYSYQITNNKNYHYSQTATTFFAKDMCKISPINFTHISYSHYYDWLLQEENTILRSALTNTHSLELTNKHLLVAQPDKKIAYPLHNISKVSFAFKRLLLPLIGGGISTPLFAVALWNHLLNFWFGIGIVMAGMSLLYYGWLGIHQLSIQVADNQIHYFADQKTQDLEQLVQQTNKIIVERKKQKE